MTQTLILLVAVILIGISLPSVMRRLEVKKSERFIFVLMAFGFLGLAWLALHAFGALL